MQGTQRTLEHSGGLVKTLTLMPIVMIGLAYIQPMTLFDTFGIVSQITSGHVPSAYALALLGILFTAFSYGKLVVRFPSAGSAYTYAQRTLSPTIGFMVGWSSLLDYLFMPMINILLAKIYFEAIVPSIPSWIFVVLLTLFMIGCNLRSLKLVAGFNGTIVCIQMGVVAVIIGLISYALIEQGGTPSLWSMKPFWDQNAAVVPMMAGAAILCFSFLGFDGLSQLTEETVDAKKTMPKAIFLTALLGGMSLSSQVTFCSGIFPISVASRTRRLRNLKSCSTSQVPFSSS